MATKKTPAQWREHLARETEPITLEELQAGLLARILGVLLDMRGAAEHTEGMVGALDVFAAGLAERTGLPYAASAKVREALDAERDERRRLAGGG